MPTKPVKAQAKKPVSGGDQGGGQKRPFTEEQVQLIRGSLSMSGNLFQLALLETGLSTCLRASDLLALRVKDLQSVDGVVDKLPVKQRKTSQMVLVRFSPKARDALMRHMQGNNLQAEQRVFKISRQTYGTIIKGWAKLAHADPRFYSTHSVRRTNPAHVYKKTQNAAAAARMLGHADLAETIAYLGVDIEEAHKLHEEHGI